MTTAARNSHLASIADLFVYGARFADSIPEHEIEATATDRRLRSFVGESGGFDTLTDNECAHVRDVIATLVA